MGDQRSDPHPDGLPEEVPDSNPDSPPAAQDDAARADVERITADRSEGIEEAGAAEPTNGD